MNVSEEELIDYIKPILKKEGFRKKRKRWTKVTEHFTFIFFIQGSCYDKDAYYVRPGIFINDITRTEEWVYGDFFIDIPVTTKEDVLKQAFEFFSEWSDVDYLKRKVSEFIEWEKRNPLEKRRANEVDYEADPVPAEVLFTLEDDAKEQILLLN